MFKLKHSFHLAALVAALAPALALAQYRPPVADSTGVRPGVTATISTGLTVNEVSNIAGGIATAIVTNAGNTTSTIPPGYKEITTAMSSHYLGSADAGLAAAGYYYGLNYPAVITSGGATSNGFGASGLSTACGADTTPRVVVMSYLEQETEGSTRPAAPNDYYVCEPMGTRSTLQKIVGATVVTISGSTLSQYVLAGTLGVNTGTATAICQAQGYTNFVQGTIAYTPWGNGCDDNQRITQYRNGAWVSDTICYNQLMGSMQCWK